MGRYPKEFQQFDQLTKRLLAVPRATLERRMAEHQEQSRQKPVRPGPKLKATRAASASPDAAGDES